MVNKIEIIIERGVHMFDLPDSLKVEFRKLLTFNNPKYVSAKRYGKWISPDLSPKLYFFHENGKENIFSLPKGCAYMALRRIKELNIPYKLYDETKEFKNVFDLKFKGSLRPYQEEAVIKMSHYPNGVLEASTGSGKTVMGLKMIEVRKQPTLILVHTKELLNQWIERIRQFLGYDAGIVGDSKFHVKLITVGLIKTVQNKIDDLKDSFGFVICDECHRVPSSTFTDVLAHFSSRYTLGLSATAFRSDKLDKAIIAFVGPKIHKVDSNMLHECGAVLKPQIIRRETDFRYNFLGEYSTMLSAVCKNETRNRLIIDDVANDIKKNNNTILVVTDRVNHIDLMSDLLWRKGIKSVTLTSKTPKDDRKAIIQGLNDGHDKIVFSTIQLIGEGFDCSNLHAIFLASPIKFDGRLLQVIGRVLRPEIGKKARVYDYRDNMVDTLLRAGISRDKLYKKQWGKV